MTQQDNYGEVVEGLFKIQTLKDGEVVDTYEEKNMIMNSARSTMAHVMAGRTAIKPTINKIKLGDLGYDGNILTPRTYDATRTQMFSEEENGHTFVVEFDSTDSSTVTPAVSAFDGNNTEAPMITSVQDTSATVIDAGASGVSMVVSVQDNITTYTVTIPQGTGNNKFTADVDVVAYTEAALYSDDNIFSFKTFPARAKDSSLELKITWSITF